MLVHKDASLTALSDLQNRHIHFPQKQTIGTIWLDVLLAQNNLPRAKQFFHKISPDQRPSQSVLAVFFKKADACIITTRSFQIISELNPQISQILTPIALSPEYLPGLSCFNKKVPLSYREILEQAAVNLGNDTAGQQVLKLFKTKKIIMFKPEYLETIEELLTQHKKYYGTQN